jgi:DNA invertase Pin-like site-specific DNA recombinase
MSFVTHLRKAGVHLVTATLDRVSTHTSDRNRRIMLHQVGIQSRHCAHLPASQRCRRAIYFPAALLGLSLKT